MIRAASSSLTDAQVTQCLASIGAFRGWQHRPLDAALERLVIRADRQTLMTLVAVSLRRLVSEPAEAR